MKRVAGRPQHHASAHVRQHWSSTTVPPRHSTRRLVSIELGTKFAPTRTVHHPVRLQNRRNTGTHTVHAVDQGGVQLARSPSPGNGVGWQQADSEPSRLTGTRFVVSYHAPTATTRPDDGSSLRRRQPAAACLRDARRANALRAVHTGTSFPNHVSSEKYWVDSSCDPAPAERRLPTVTSRFPAAAATTSIRSRDTRTFSAAVTLDDFV